jgi:hypothetical protein
MQLQVTWPLISPLMRRIRQGDRIMQGLIVGGGVSVLLMLAWAHLGLSALIFPPATTPARMVAVSGPYSITLVARTRASSSWVTAT